MTKHTDNIDLVSSLYALADELSQLVLREHQILQGEMKQIGALISDAVKNIDGNFRDMRARVSEQAEIMSKVLDNGCINEEQQRKFSEISNKINVNTSQTIRVLQFDDIVQQLTGHTRDRIARMQELFNELEVMISRIRSEEKLKPREIKKYLHMMQEEVGRFRVKLEKENPVKQSSMEEGKIELF